MRSGPTPWLNVLIRIHSKLLLFAQPFTAMTKRNSRPLSRTTIQLAYTGQGLWLGLVTEGCSQSLSD